MSLRKRLLQDSGNVSANAVLFAEHPPTYTAGRRIRQSTDSDRLKALGAEYFEIQRGGQTTFHGPGQLIVYPIVNLRHFKIGPRDYVNRLEQVIIDTCIELGINAHRTSDTGVWVNDAKIAAIGVQITQGIAIHGFALNCCTDLKWFSHIVPCGIKDKSVTSISEQLGSRVDTLQVFPIVKAKFENHFSCSLVNFS